MSFETLEIGKGIYTISDLSEILKVSKSKVRYWLNTYVRDILPSITGHKYVFDEEKGLFVNFKSLLQLYVFIELKKRGHKKKDIIEMYKFIAKKYQTNYPFATKQILSVGSEILINGDSGLINYKFQLSFDKLLKDYIEKIDFDSHGNAIRFYPLGMKRSIVVDPEIQFGSPTIKGTRIDVRTIAECFEAGDSKKLISKAYNLKLKEINDAIDFVKAA